MLSNFLDLQIPPALQVLVLAPHPDDFDAIAITLRHLHRQGATLHLAVLTGGASGVAAEYPGAVSHPAKIALREHEQRASCAFFGLAPAHIKFLNLAEDEKGHLQDGPENQAQIRACLQAANAQWVFLPHGKDSNVTHQRTYSLMRSVALADGLKLRAFLNQDAKTLQMRHDLFTPFDAAAAAWKAELLRFHDTQQQRNLSSRGTGFDERVLTVNKATAQALQLAAHYAEAFEVENYPQQTTPPA